MAIYLAFKEIWRNKGRFMLFSGVIALITVLVLFVAALGLGLSNANRQLLDKLDVDLLVIQENSDLSLTASRLNRSTANAVRRINGVEAAGMVAFSNGSVIAPGVDPVDVSLVGVEPGMPGNPALLDGIALRNKRGDEVIIDENLAEQTGLTVGDELVIRTIQGDDEEFFTLRIIGITDERQYFFQAAVFMPIYTWNEVRPQQAGPASGEPIANTIAVVLSPDADVEEMTAKLATLVNGVDVADIETTAKALPGYSAQKITVETQRAFALVIGVLVVGGFFQIQTLQKVPQIGMLKAIGTDNVTVGLTSLAQIILVTLIGVAIGGVVVFLLQLGLPPVVPLRFNFVVTATALASLLLIGPLGGMVSVRMALRIEPLTAIGLSS